MFRSNGRIRRCAICGRDVWAGRLCGVHGNLAYVAAAIAAGRLTEFPPDESMQRTYHELQTDARWQFSGNWRVQVAVLLTALKVRFPPLGDDGQAA